MNEQDEYPHLQYIIGLRNEKAGKESSESQGKAGERCEE